MRYEAEFKPKALKDLRHIGSAGAARILAWFRMREPKVTLFPTGTSGARVWSSSQ
jgi:hypothetical protein